MIKHVIKILLAVYCLHSVLISQDIRRTNEGKDTEINNHGSKYLLRSNDQDNNTQQNEAGKKQSI